MKKANNLLLKIKLMLLIYKYLKTHNIFQFKIKIFEGINEIIIIYNLFSKFDLYILKLEKKMIYNFNNCINFIFEKDKVLIFKN